MRVGTLRAWRPSELDDAAAGFEAAHRALDSAAADAADAVRPLRDSWEGDASSAARRSADRQGRDADELGNALSLVRRILTAAGDAIRPAQFLLEDGIALARRHGLWVGDDATVSAPPPYLLGADAPPAQVAAARDRFEAAGDARVQAQAMVNQALAAAEEADDDAATALRRVLPSAADGSTWDAADVASIAAITGRDIPAEGTDPREVSAWWASVTPAAQSILIGGFPERIGMLDGVPVAVRDRANRVVLGDTLDDLDAEIADLQGQLTDLPAPSGRMGPSSPHVQIAAQMAKLMEQRDMLRVVQEQLGADPDRHLMLLDTGMPGRAAIAIGDVDTADNVAVLVPGLDSFVTNYMDKITANAERLQSLSEEASRALGTGETTATIAWIGYEAPNALTVAADGHAKAGAELLDSTLWGIEANRAVSGTDVHLTTLGHSYGSLVTGLTAAGDTPMDDLVMFGSPGVGTDHVSGLTLPADRVFVGEAKWDVVSDLDWFGTDPADPDFGAVTFQTDGGHHPLADTSTRAVSGHSDYYARDSESLWNITSVVVGEPQMVTQGHTSGWGDVIREGFGRT